MKKTALILAVLLLSGSSMLFAGGKCGKMMEGKGRDMDLSEKFLMKAHFIMENADALGLSDETVEAIKKLKAETKKMLIKKEAEIEVLGLDIETALHEAKIDTAAIDKLIDQKYALKIAKAKALVAAYAQLKGMLTDDQKAAMKKLWKEKKNEMKSAMRESVCKEKGRHR